MIYVHKDGTGYTEFPVPEDMTGYLAVGGVTEQRIKAGDPYRLLNDGQVVEFWTTQEVDAAALTKAKAAKRAELDAARRAATAAGVPFTFPGAIAGTVQTRPADRTNIAELALAAQANPSGSFTFRDSQNRNHTLTGAEVTQLAQDVQAMVAENYSAAWMLKDQVEAATTVAAVEAISWE